MSFVCFQNCSDTLFVFSKLPQRSIISANESSEAGYPSTFIIHSYSLEHFEMSVHIRNHAPKERYLSPLLKRNIYEWQPDNSNHKRCMKKLQRYIFCPEVPAKYTNFNTSKYFTNEPQIREQMSCPDILRYEKSILGCGLWSGLDCEIKEFGLIMSNFLGLFFKVFMDKRLI